MAIEKMTNSFLKATRRVLMSRIIESNCLPKSSLTARFIWTNVRPNVNIKQCLCVATAQVNSGYNVTLLSTTTQPHAVKRSSVGSKIRNKDDPIARFGDLNPSSPKLGFEKIKELEDADERVKKIFSLEFADNREIRVYRRDKLIEKVQKDPLDTKSLPVKIALATMTIRTAARQYERNKKDLRSKNLLLGSIGRRRKLLKYLRKTDYERFERLLVELGITYTIPPTKTQFMRRSKRYLEKLTVFRGAREKRLEALDNYLAEEREAKMREIVALKKELNVEFTEEEMKYLEENEKN